MTADMVGDPPRCFLQVLIPGDFNSFNLCVRIPKDLQVHSSQVRMVKDLAVAGDW